MEAEEIDKDLQVWKDRLNVMIGKGHRWKREEVGELKLVRERVKVKGLNKEIVESCSWEWEGG